MTKEELKEKYPEQFKDCWEISIGKGWMFLLQNLCYYVDEYELSLKNDLKYATKYKDDKDSNWFGKLETIQEKLKNLEENPFRWVQIKEKFGGARLYCSGCPNDIYPMIRYAEALSYDICEDCGCPATVKTNGWIRNLCEPCAITSKAEYNKK